MSSLNTIKCDKCGKQKTGKCTNWWVLHARNRSNSRFGRRQRSPGKSMWIDLCPECFKKVQKVAKFKPGLFVV